MQPPYLSLEAWRWARCFCSSYRWVMNQLAELPGCSSCQGHSSFSFSHSQARCKSGPQLLLPDTCIIEIGNLEAEAGPRPPSSHIPVCPCSPQLLHHLFFLISCFPAKPTSDTAIVHKHFNQFPQLCRVKFL